MRGCHASRGARAATPPPSRPPDDDDATASGAAHYLVVGALVCVAIVGEARSVGGGVQVNGERLMARGALRGRVRVKRLHVVADALPAEGVVAAGDDDVVGVVEAEAAHAAALEARSCWRCGGGGTQPPRRALL